MASVFRLCFRNGLVLEIGGSTVRFWPSFMRIVRFGGADVDSLLIFGREVPADWRRKIFTPLGFSRSALGERAR